MFNTKRIKNLEKAIISNNKWISDRISALIGTADRNGRVAQDIMNFLLEKGGYTLIVSPTDEKILKTLSKEQFFQVGNETFVIAKKSIVDRINKEGKKTKAKK